MAAPRTIEWVRSEHRLALGAADADERDEEDGGAEAGDRVVEVGAEDALRQREDDAAREEGGAEDAGGAREARDRVARDHAPADQPARGRHADEERDRRAHAERRRRLDVLVRVVVAAAAAIPALRSTSSAA